MRIEGERVFLTGGAGFLGRHLARMLVDRGASCVVFDKRKGDEESTRDLPGSGKVELVHGNLLTAKLDEAMRGCTAVFHLAADPDVRSGEDRPGEIFEQNVLVTAKVLDGMRGAGIERLLFTSTSTVYGEATVLPTPEDYEPLAPISLYGASKLAAEGLIHGYASQHPLTAVVCRFANVVGGGATHGVIYDFVRKLRENPREMEIFGRDPGTYKSYVHVDDAVAAMLRGWTVTDDGVQVFNVGSDDAISVREIADTVCRVMGLANVKYRWTGGVEGGGWKGDLRSMRLAVEKLKTMGWSPGHSSSEAVSRAAQALAAAE